MNTKIKVTIEYLGQHRSPTSHDYKVLQIDGAPTVEVQDTQSQGTAYIALRVGDILNEKQATELSNRVVVSTRARKH